ncbi:MAG: pore-forming ESAT-6 family protein [Firmicutes bacterium]|nr:pore-forming ESAT-6 family protein [[Eubacterium] siraeum]MCM1487900.1 pore-forming ESAT-6 family protein [Bacillota bacterium]
MADSIKISTQVLNDTAAKIRSINNTLDAKLAEISKTVNNLNDTWKSQASGEIIATMNALKPRFNDYKEVIDNYAKFLDNTAQSYETAESTISANASSFK